MGRIGAGGGGRGGWRGGCSFLQVGGYEGGGESERGAGGMDVQERFGTQDELGSGCGRTGTRCTKVEGTITVQMNTWKISDGAGPSLRETAASPSNHLLNTPEGTPSLLY